MTKPMRAPTGKMQFENDWPGVFIRGDDALIYARTIHALLAAGTPHDLSDEMNEWRSHRLALLELAALLESCRVKSKSPRKRKPQHLREAETTNP